MKKTTAFSLLFLVSACAQIPSGAYFDRGQPEGLLEASSEVVHMNLHTTNSELASMIKQDPPTRVQINCNTSDKACSKALNLFESHSIPVEASAGTQGITLIYERVIARDCEQRYIDNTINPYNLNHPTLGCSNAANMVQMVSNRQDFINPSLLDHQDAERSILNYRVYLSPPPPPSTDDSSQLDELNTN